ncbi:hypothetical protein AB833_09815 [Chromatiales bacterium (ex Bugula neritina AB1)]|nr:hypothetical protein AB833_09815 [Chromatiales bacterium (ex Bugula neritina AB1)]
MMVRRLLPEHREKRLGCQFDDNHLMPLTDSLWSFVNDNSVAHVLNYPIKKNVVEFSDRGCSTGFRNACKFTLRRERGNGRDRIMKSQKVSCD